MKQTTLCYLMKDEQILLMHRNKKSNDPNQNKWIGVGGHVKRDETVEDAMKREVFEETGYILHQFIYHGVVFFNSNQFESEIMHLYSSHDFSGLLTDSIEGSLKWVNRSSVFDLNLWEGDHIFLTYMLEFKPFFHLTLNYEKDRLVSYHVEYPDEKSTLHQ